MPPKNTPETKQVRVRVREVGYQGYVTSQTGDTALTILRGYGPGQPQLDPASVLGPDADPSSQEYKDAEDQFRRGQIIELLKDDYERHKKYGAVVDLGDEAELEGDEEGEILDVATASVEELSEWIAENRPTVNEVVQASGGDPDLARKLLEAESNAQDGEPRKGVFDGLSAVLGRA